jgi:hypothetical protein
MANIRHEEEPQYYEPKHVCMPEEAVELILYPELQFEQSTVPVFSHKVPLEPILLATVATPLGQLQTLGAHIGLLPGEKVL